MKVAAVETFVLREKLSEPFGYSQAWYDTRTAMLVRVVLEDGTAGWGEAFGPASSSAAIVNEKLAPLVVGCDVRDTLPLWERMYAATRDYGQKGLVVNAISAVDIALWDAKARYLGQPIHTLLGGQTRDRVQVYATGLYFRPYFPFVDALVQEARGYVDAGFRAVKMKVGYSPEVDLKHVRAVREALGPDIALMVDANHAYDATTAIHLGREFERLSIGWFEEPVIPEDIEAYVEVARALDMPVAGGECEYTRFGFRRLFAARAVDIVQPDLTVSGGFTECQRVLALASAWGIRYLPHVWGSAVGMAAGLQFAAAMPPATQSLFPMEPILEFDRTPNRFREDITSTPIRQEDGWLRVPGGPGLGIDILDEAVRNLAVAAYTVGRVPSK
jgi:D-galactarolactone cycloisomerase